MSLKAASNLAAAVALVGIVFATAKDVASQGRRAADIVVVAGQSNAVGYGLGLADVPPALNKADSRVKIWTGSAFVPMAPGVNTGTRRFPRSWGPEAGFASQWRAAHPSGDLFIVKSAKGSTPLAATAGLDWAPQSGELFADTSLAVRKAKAVLVADGRAPKVRAILWMQGEADAMDPGKASAYRANLTRALAAMRADWGDDSTRIVLGRITGGFPQAGAVRAAQGAVVAATGAALVDTDGYPLQDGVHYAARGQARLGSDMYRAYAAPCQAGSAKLAQCSSGVRPDSIKPGVAAR